MNRSEPHRSNPVGGGRTRRDLLKFTLATGLAAALGGSRPARARASLQDEPLEQQRAGELFRAAPIENVRIGFVGVGGMGTHHVRNLVAIPGCTITAVCDVVEAHASRAQDIVEQAGHPRPAAYTRGETDFQRMCDEGELDLVYTATPWEWHVPICVYAMRTGKHAATEVPAAYTVEGCWELVEAAEKAARHCVMMENCCYDRPELLTLHLVRRGLLGEVLHGQAGYMHDLRAIKFSTAGEGLWRRRHSIEQNGNLYTTHGLGPVAQCMNINRGDRFERIVSMSSPSRGLQLWQQEHLKADDPRRGETYKLGDVNVSLIQTQLGRTIYLAHDTNLPRPYSRLFSVQGTRGLVEAYPRRVHIEGRSPDHRWEEMGSYFEEFDHPLWKRHAERAAGGGHGGMDYLENLRLIQCLNRGEPLDMDVYDAAAWSVVGPCSEQSVARRAEPIEIPDFTRGAWRVRPQLEIVSG